ncbi:hypothetical protein DL96DRAFT_858039 [Flagelloscypha sp. PMI_526]|nr:hypothetical protein DL96DRAFT_858039 [Flagelloscypha sp. PMI_526]
MFCISFGTLCQRFGPVHACFTTHFYLLDIYINTSLLHPQLVEFCYLDFNCLVPLLSPFVLPMLYIPLSLLSNFLSLVHCRTFSVKHMRRSSERDRLVRLRRKKRKRRREVLS